MVNYSVVALKPVQVITPLLNGAGNALTEGVLVSDNGTTAMVRLKGRQVATAYPSAAVKPVPSIRSAKRIPTSMSGSGPGAFVHSLNAKR